MANLLTFLSSANYGLITTSIGIVLLLALAAWICWRVMFRRVRGSVPNENKLIAGVIPNHIRWTAVSLAPTPSLETEMAITIMTLFPEEHGINDM